MHERRTKDVTGKLDTVIRVRLSGDLKARLERASTAHECSESAITRLALLDFLARAEDIRRQQATAVPLNAARSA